MQNEKQQIIINHLDQTSKFVTEEDGLDQHGLYLTMSWYKVVKMDGFVIDANKILVNGLGAFFYDQTGEQADRIYFRDVKKFEMTK